MADSLVEAAGLHTYYGASHILRGVDLTVGRGETIGLMGRNGMGKSTLLKTLMGLVPPRAGSVRVMGREMAGRPPFEIAQLGIAYVPEGRGIFGNLSVAENLRMAARPGRGARRGTDWTFERVMETFPRLQERLGHGGQQLSGGEQQMLSIGRALMTHPQLLVLDEATEGLAPLIVAEIWRVVATIRASGIATLVVDRNVHAVLAHTDRCVVLEKGLVVLSGTSEKLARDGAALTRLLGV